MGDEVADLMPWVHAHIMELQSSGLIATCIILLLALVLLNRTASELHRSRSSRANNERSFERIHFLLSAARDQSDLGEAVGHARRAANEAETPREALN